MTRYINFRFKLSFRIIAVLWFIQIVSGCGQQDLEEVLPAQAAVSSHMTWSPQSLETFAYGDLESEVAMTLNWEAFNSSIEIREVEFFIKWEEQISDGSKTQVIEHGTPNSFGEIGGEPFARISQRLSSNDNFLKVAITQEMIFEVFQQKVQDYGQGAAEVFAQNGRSAAFPFKRGDQFELTWKLIDQNGNAFSSWASSICNGAESNCSFSWSLNCISDLAGRYSFVVNGQSSYLTSDLGKDSDDFSYDGEMELLELGNGYYSLPDLTGSFEPEIWGNPAVSVQIVEECGVITLEESTFDYLYQYRINEGSYVDENGRITINWCNLYEECGTLEMIPL